MKASLCAIILVLLTPICVFSQHNSGNLPIESNSKVLENYSISLNVNDLKASIAFYEKLGFTPVDGLGSIEQRWVIISNGSSKMGLFQGFFPTNTITFNPTDARRIFKSLTEKGIEPVMQLGMDQENGPCTFSILDPDGNPILIDQH